MDEGELVPDDVMIGIVAERLGKPDARTRGYILDGFPRTVPQAEALDEITAEQPIDVVIDLEVPRELVLRRLAARRVCQDCGTNYTATGPREDCPGSATCAAATWCSAPTTPRRPSTAASTSTRRQTAPLIELLRRAAACSRWSTASARPTR